jgi:hypothetical protein
MIVHAPIQVRGRDVSLARQPSLRPFLPKKVVRNYFFPHIEMLAR